MSVCATDIDRWNEVWNGWLLITLAAATKGAQILKGHRGSIFLLHMHMVTQVLHSFRQALSHPSFSRRCENPFSRHLNSALWCREIMLYKVGNETSSNQGSMPNLVGVQLFFSSAVVGLTNRPRSGFLISCICNDTIQKQTQVSETLSLPWRMNIEQWY